MVRNDFTTAHAAAHIAHYLHARPIRRIQLLSLDERINQVRAALLTAKATDNQPEIARLPSVWADVSAEIEAEAVTTADLEADALLPFELTVAELRESGALPPLDICPICKEVKDDLGRCGCDYTQRLDLDCCVAAIDQARSERSSKRLESAWAWLSERSAVTFTADGALVVDSATWANARYHVRADGTCDCPARKPCWHLEAWTLVEAALESAEIERLAECWA